MDSDNAKQNTIQIYTVSELAALLGLSKPKVYELIHSKRIKAFKVGRSIRVSGHALQNFIETEEF